MDRRLEAGNRLAERARILAGVDARQHDPVALPIQQGKRVREARTAAREWAPTGVTVNALCPAAKSQAFFRAIGDYPELEAMADAANPMGRMGDPYDDIAPVAVFLAGEGSRYLTGNTLFVDGGSHINGVSWAPELPE